MGKKRKQKTPSSYEGDDAPVEAGTHVNAFLLADLGKRVFNVLISKSSLILFHQFQSFEFKNELRCEMS